MKTCEIVHCPGKTDIYALRLSHEVDGVMTLSAGYTKKQAEQTAARLGFTVVAETPREWVEAHQKFDREDGASTYFVLCPECDKQFETKRPESQFCSHACFHRFRRRDMVTKKAPVLPVRYCQVCNAPYQSNQALKKFCTSECRNKASSLAHKKNFGLEAIA